MDRPTAKRKSPSSPQKPDRPDKRRVSNPALPKEISLPSKQSISANPLAPLPENIRNPQSSSTSYVSKAKNASIISQAGKVAPLGASRVAQFHAKSKTQSKRHSISSGSSTSARKPSFGESAKTEDISKLKEMATVQEASFASGDSAIQVNDETERDYKVVSLVKDDELVLKSPGIAKTSVPRDSNDTFSEISIQREKSVEPPDGVAIDQLETPDVHGYSDSDDEFDNLPNQDVGDITNFSEFTADVTSLDKICRAMNDMTRANLLSSPKDENDNVLGLEEKSPVAAKSASPIEQLGTESIAGTAQLVSSATPRTAAQTPRSESIGRQSKYSESILSTPAQQKFLGSASPTPIATRTTHARTGSFNSGNTTNLLIDDFTQQFYDIPNKIYGRQPRPKTPTSPRKHPLSQSTPNEKRFLIDFDIPPPPTPRSIPSITPREVEQLKAEFLTQLATLKAEIKGRDAMVEDLKEAVGNAESRCGIYREELENLKADLEDTRSTKQAVETKLAGVREVMQEMEQKLGDAEEARKVAVDKLEQTLLAEEEGKRASDVLSIRLQKLEELYDEEKEKTRQLQVEVERLQNGEHRSVSTVSGLNTLSSETPASLKGVSREEVDRIAKELHLLYKQKHEMKVAALKKSYEQRWENKVKDLEKTCAQLKAKNEKLQTTEPAAQPAPMSHVAKNEELVKEIETLSSAVEEVENNMKKMSQENEELRKENVQLKRENGELVEAAEEMLQLQAAGGGPSPEALPGTEGAPLSLKGGIELMGKGVSR